MRASKLFKLLRTFENHEWKDCRRYISSRVREDAEVLKVYDYILRYKSNLSHKKLELTFANKELFNNRSIKLLQNLMSKIHKHILDYLAIEHILQNPRDKSVSIAIALNKRKLYQEAHDQYLSTYEIIQNGKLDISDTLLLFQMSNLFHYSENKTHPDYKIFYLNRAEENWAKTKKAHNLSLLLQLIVNHKFFHADKSSDIQHLYNENNSNHALDDAAELLNKIVLCFDKAEPKAYDYLYERFVRNADTNISEELGIITFHTLISYQNHILRNGKGSLEDLVNCFHQGLQSGFLIYNNTITDARFMLMIHASASSSQFTRARELMNKWKHLLKDQNKQCVLRICESTILLYERKYEESSDLLVNHSFKDKLTKRTARLLELLSMIALYDDKDYVISQIQNFQRSYRRQNQNFSTEHLTGIERMCQVLMAIKRKESYESIMAALNEEKPLNRRNYLRQYLEHEKAKA